MTLGPFQEITVSQSSKSNLFAMRFIRILNVFCVCLFTDPTELKNLIAAVSNIPEDRIEHAKVNIASSSCSMILNGMNGSFTSHTPIL